MFDLARIMASGLVARIDYHESLGSTNDHALALAAQGEAELPLLVLTERQTAGRGRGTNRWWTGKGAIAFSLVLEASPHLLPPDHWPHVGLMAGLAVCDALQPFVPAAELRLKWPNDVYLAGRKLSGILSESVPGWRDRLVVGIGVNVNNSLQESPLAIADSLGSTGRSLIDHDGVERDLTAVLLAVLDELDRRWRSLLYEDFSALAEDYRRRCFLTGKTVTVEQPGGTREIGICLGIGDRGVLRLRTVRGERSITSGTVVLWEG